MVKGSTNPLVVASPMSPISISVPPTHQAAHWPKLAVTGVMASNGSRGMAFVNGQLVSSGDEIQAASVVEVTANGVKFIWQDATNFVRIGHSTEQLE